MEGDWQQNFSNWLDSFLNFEKLPQKDMFWLDSMQFLCEKLGNPQYGIPLFHVGGSKGKGSVSQMIASVLSEAGMSCGVYTSPHLLSLKERICSAKGFFSDEVYAVSAQQLKQTVDKIPLSELPGNRPLTWFELVTLWGMLCMKNAGVDSAVYEVGLGGRLDATNVILPSCACIGPVELEHTEYLGDTLEKIAYEKAGIIKPNVPVVIGWQQKKSVYKVFEKKAEEVNSPVIYAQKASKVTQIVYKNRLTNGSKCAFDATEPLVSMDCTIKSPLFSHPLKPSLKLLGDFQAQNAAVASLAVKTVFPSLSEDIIERGLSKASLPARFELVSHACGLPFILFDGAHTVRSVTGLLKTISDVFGKKTARSLHMLYASASDKDVEDIARLFRNKTAHVTLTRPGTTKASDMPRLQKAFSDAGISFESEEDTLRAFSKACERARKDNAPLLVTGSFYLIAAVKPEVTL